MNLRKMQDAKLIYRNLSHFYTLTMNYKNEKLGRQSHLQSHQIEKIKKYLAIDLPKEIKELFQKIIRY